MGITESTKTGAALISWDMFSYRNLMKKVLRANKDKTEKEVLEAFREEVLLPENKEFLDSVILYASKNAYMAARRDLELEEKAASKKVPAEKVVQYIAQEAQNKEFSKVQAKAAPIADVISKFAEAAKKQEAAIDLMNMLMPSGKFLKDCTVGEARQQSAAMFKSLEGLPPDAIVGDVLSPTELINRYEEA